jgi:hypothetical protein
LPSFGIAAYAPSLGITAYSSEDPDEELGWNATGRKDL